MLVLHYFRRNIMMHAWGLHKYWCRMYVRASFSAQEVETCQSPSRMRIYHLESKQVGGKLLTFGKWLLWKGLRLRSIGFLGFSQGIPGPNICFCSKSDDRRLVCMYVWFPCKQQYQLVHTVAYWYVLVTWTEQLQLYVQVRLCLCAFSYRIESCIRIRKMWL